MLGVRETCMTTSVLVVTNLLKNYEHQNSVLYVIQLRFQVHYTN